ncbi:MAG: glycoside hydrolase family 15 protein [Leptospirales bacterium]
MPRDLPIGNGSLFLCFDEHYQIREITFPYAGAENHTVGHPCRFGFFTGGHLYWINTREWDLSLNYQKYSLTTNVTGRSSSLALSFKSRDCVDFYENTWVRELSITNESSTPQEVRPFFSFDFHINGTEVGDTAAFNPSQKTITHYKKGLYFTFNMLHPDEGPGISCYATGRKELPGNDGTYRDAEDGILSLNPIAQGSVDSTFGCSLMILPGDTQKLFVWMIVANSWDQSEQLTRFVTERHPASFLDRTHNYWKFWVNQDCFHAGLGEVHIPSLSGDPDKDVVQRLRQFIPDEFQDDYTRSLLILRAHISHNGASAASIDSDSLYLSRDTYSYLWPRDGANITLAFSQAGYHGLARRFYYFCGDIIKKEGYFLHKYNLDGSLASSWHPWIRNHAFQLPIQEDETGYILWTLKEHFQIDRDFDFITPLYKKVIKPAGIFLRDYRDLSTGLPLASYDLWEERHGTFLHTAALVWAGLMGAAYFSGSFGEIPLCHSFLKAATEIKSGVMTFMRNNEKKIFYRSVQIEEGQIIERDETPDISAMTLVETGFLDPDNSEERLMIVSLMDRLEKTLKVPGPIGGYARYVGDQYYLSDESRKLSVPGNPWFISAFWMAQGYIKLGTDDSIEKAMELLRWGTAHASSSGVMAEQIDPASGSPLSVAPLAWSHAAMINALHVLARHLMGLKAPLNVSNPP